MNLSLPGYDHPDRPSHAHTRAHKKAKAASCEVLQPRGHGGIAHFNISEQGLTNFLQTFGEVFPLRTPRSTPWKPAAAKGGHKLPNPFVNIGSFADCDSENPDHLLNPSALYTVCGAAPTGG